MTVDGVSSNSATKTQESAPQQREKRAESSRAEAEQRDRSPPRVEGKGERVDTAA